MSASQAIRGQPMDVVDVDVIASATYLGFTISFDLSLSVPRQKDLIAEPFELLVARLYKSLVLPVLDYCGGAVWYSYQIKYKIQLDRVQRFAVKAITNSWIRDASPLLQSLKWPSLERCINLATC